MNRKIKTALAAATIFLAAALSNGAAAQSRSDAQGVLFNRDVMTIADLGTLSQSSTIFGTARAMGLGGAITSLGGDATSMIANPAGMAMSKGREISFTPSFNFGDGSFSMDINNLAATTSIIPKSSGSILNLNIGVGYTKVADHNYNFGYSKSGASSNVANLFSEQLNSNGILLDDLQGTDYPDWNTLQTRLWGAALGYKGGMSDYDNGTWSPTWLSSSALTEQNLHVESRGATNDISANFSANLSNKLYLGVGVSVVTVDQSMDIMYNESYSNNNLSTSALLYSEYNQAIVISGAGANVKFGATYRPIPALRVAVAYHTPTYFSVERQYQASVGTISDTDGTTTTIISDSPVIEDSGRQKWQFSTQSKLLTGISYTFGQRALLSFDYQRDWYGQIKMSEMPSGVDATLYDGIDQLYQAVNTFRLGGEFRLTPQFALRGGYGFSTAMVRSDVTASDLLGISTMDKMQYFTAGVGYSVTNNLAFDVTYMNMTRNSSSYTSFYGTSADAQSEIYSSKLNNNTIAISMSLKL
ncbi:MAG: hypothetical protein SNH79_03045 [Rikenellaceae bacterium]